MADADLDVVIRLLAKQQNKGLMAAAKGRRDRYLSLAAKAKDKEAKERYKQIAKNTMLHGAAAATRLQISADNAAEPKLVFRANKSGEPRFLSLAPSCDAKTLLIQVR